MLWTESTYKHCKDTKFVGKLQIRALLLLECLFELQILHIHILLEPLRIAVNLTRSSVPKHHRNNITRHTLREREGREAVAGHVAGQVLLYAGSRGQ